MPAGETLNKDAAEVVDIIFSTLPLYDDRHSQAAVVELISRGLKEASFVKAFAGALVQTIEKSHKTSSDAVRLKLLRWSCLLIMQVPTLLSAKSAFGRLAPAQGFLLASLYQASVPVRKAAGRIFNHYLTNVRYSFLELYPSATSTCAIIELGFVHSIRPIHMHHIRNNRLSRHEILVC